MPDALKSSCPSPSGAAALHSIVSAASPTPELREARARHEPDVYGSDDCYVNDGESPSVRINQSYLAPAAPARAASPAETLIKILSTASANSF